MTTSPLRRCVAAVALGAMLLPAGAAAIKLRPDAILAGYRQVLATLTEEGPETALEALFAFETRALERLPPSGDLERYWRLKLRVIRDLLEAGQVDQLVPIIGLHHDAFEIYRQRDQPVLAAHSRTMAAELAEILAERSDERQVELFSGWVLTSFGGYLQESRSISSSVDFFRRALAIDPGNKTALLGMASAMEKVGRYVDAVPPLEKAVFLDDGFDQARLRLALCLLRAGSADAARPHFERLIDAAIEPWIRSVAVQEWARHLAGQGAAAAAEALLRRALDELPDPSQPALLLSSMLEFDRRPREAARVLQAIEASAEASPRYIYDSWPAAGIEEGRLALREMMHRRLQVLADGLRAGAAVGRGR